MVQQGHYQVRVGVGAHVWGFVWGCAGIFYKQACCVVRACVSSRAAIRCMEKKLVHHVSMCACMSGDQRVGEAGEERGNREEQFV